jgi:hypothetical protein
VRDIQRSMWAGLALAAMLLAAASAPAGAEGADDGKDAPHGRELSAYAAKAWKQTRGRMTDILETMQEKPTLPRNSWTKRDQGDAEEDIQDLLQDVLDALQHSALTDHRGEYAELDEQIAEGREELRESREARITADDEKSVLGFFKLTRSGYAERIDKLEKEIAAYEKEKESLVEELRAEYERMGLKLSADEVRFYLTSVSGRDIMALSAVFDNVRALNGQLEDLMRGNPGDPEAARRYYGIHVVLLRTVIRAHEVTLANITDRYLKRIAELEEQNAAVSAETTRLLRKAPDGQRGVLEASRQAQRTTDEALELYRKHLVNVQQRIEKGLDALQKRYAVTRNAYDTIAISSALAEQMQTAIQDLATLSGMHLPDLVPFDSAAIAQKFSEITTSLEEQ